jgi:3-phenylpropionate/cinnamic acid dioxygenase small subunit
MTSFNDQQLADFVYAEARLLDEQHFDQWLALFTDDGHYWMPLARNQTDPILQGSLMYEDLLLLKVRIERLSGQRTYSQQPKSHSHHLLARPEIETTHASHQPEKGQYVVRTAFHYIESRQDQQWLFAGWATHELVTQDGALRIRQKRVDLVNCDTALDAIQLFM